MDYTIGRTEKFEKGIKRVINEQVDRAILHLTEAEDPHKGVHGARRSLKVTRAALRLIRDDLEAEKYHKMNCFYRDQGRKLSELRDATAMMETLELMEKVFARKLKAGTIEMLHQKLDQEREKLKAGGQSENSLMQEVAERLRSCRTEIDELQLSEAYPIHVINSIFRVYQRGCEGLKANDPNPHDEKMHDWRKRTKYLHYQMQIISKAWTVILTPYKKELNKLTEFQGNYQNLTVLIQYLTEPDALLEPEERDNLLKLATHHQQKLHQRALPLGRKIYAETPVAFTKRLGVYLKSWPAFGTSAGK